MMHRHPYYTSQPSSEINPSQASAGEPFHPYQLAPRNLIELMILLNSKFNKHNLLIRYSLT